MKLSMWKRFSLVFAATLSAFIAVSPRISQAAATRSTAIARLRATGAIDDEMAVIYQVLSYRRPELLPSSLRSLAPSSAACATEHFVRGFQLKPSGRLSAWATSQYALATARPTSVGYYDSTRYRLRVHYTDPSLSAVAGRVLEYAEYAWQYQVGTVGFAPPVGDFPEYGGSDALDIYVGDAQGALGFTAPEFEWPATSRSDCTAWVVIDKSIPDGDTLKVTVAHEFNHVLQAAYDCLEWVSFWENTATYVESLTYDAINDYVGFLPGFQSRPEEPFELFESGNPYQYGGMLVPMVLDEAYGQADGRSVRRAWELSVQDGFSINEPDYFDAIDQVVKAHGGTGLDQFQRTLTEWRYLVGARDDGGHLSEASSWASACGEACEPPEERVLDRTDLPASGTASTAVWAHGSSYVRLDLGTSLRGSVQVDFTGQNPGRWASALICAGPGGTTVTPLAASGAGQLSAEATVANTEYCTLAATSLGPSDYDPDLDYDSLSSSDAYYAYELRFLPDSTLAPQILSISPTPVACSGAPQVTLTGRNFAPELVVSLDGAPVSVVSVSSDSVVFVAPPRSQPGAAVLVVTNPDGQQALSTLAFDGSGCPCVCDVTTGCDDDCDCDPECRDGGCQSAPRSYAPLVIVLALAALLSGWARRFGRPSSR